MNVSRIRYNRDLVFVLLSKEFRLRYKHTVLGYAWSVLHPLAFACVFFFVFKKIINLGIPNYILFLISGLFPWQWFQNSLNASNMFFLSNGSLIKKVRFPRETLVLAGVLNDLVHFVVSLPVILIFMLYYKIVAGQGNYPSLAWLWGVPLLVVVQMMLTYGMSLAMATANVFFRDLERLTGIVLMLWFYLTPVFFDVTNIPERFRWIIYVNPMAALIVCWRSVLLDGVLPVAVYGAALGIAVAALLGGRAIYKSLEWRLAEVV